MAMTGTTNLRLISEREH